MGVLIDTERKGCESIIHDHDCDLWVTMVGWVDVPFDDWGDFRRRRAVDISSSYLFFEVLSLAFIRSFILSHSFLSFWHSFQTHPTKFYNIQSHPRCAKWAYGSDCRGRPKHLKMCILAPRHKQSVQQVCTDL